MFLARTGLFSRQTQTAAVGLDVGFSCIKAVEVTWQGLCPQLSNLAVATIPEHCRSWNSSPAARQQLSAIIRQMFADARITSTRIIAALDSQVLFLRNFLLPEMSLKQLRTALHWELSSCLPPVSGGYNFDFSITGWGPQLSVLAVAAPRHALLQLEQLLYHSQLCLTAVDALPLAAWRTFPHQPSLIIDLGATHTSLSIFDSSQLKFWHTLPQGILPIAKLLDTDPQLPSATNTPLRAKREALIAELAQDINRTLLHYQQQTLSQRLPRAFLIGGGADFVYLRHKLASALNLDLTVHNPWRPFSAIPPHLANHLPAAAQLTAAAGLALKGVCHEPH